MKRFLLLITVLAFSVSSQTQNLPKFSYKDANGCAFEFKLESINGQEVALLSAKNNKKPRLEIPSTVIESRGQVFDSCGKKTMNVLRFL